MVRWTISSDERRELERAAGVSIRLSFPSPGPREARPEDKLQRESNFSISKMDARFRGHDK
jgi:hypothetical protein